MNRTTLRGHGRTFRELNLSTGKTLGVRVKSHELARLEELARKIPNRGGDYRQHTATAAARRILTAALADDRWIVRNILSERGRS